MVKERRTSIKNKSFIRSFTYEGGDHKVSGMFQPYIVGMYAAITDNKAKGLIQLNLPHSSFNNWCKRLFKKFEKEGMTGESYRADYTDYLSEKDIEEYGIFD